MITIAMYFSSIKLSTVGYGEVTPALAGARCLVFEQLRSKAASRDGDE